MPGRSSTGPFPGNPRAQWVRTFLVQPHFEDGFIQFAYSLHASQAAKRARELPFLFDSHKAQLRETHQRILKTGPRDRHVSGALVLPQDIDDFMENDPAFYDWVAKTDALWTASDGRTLVPFMFPTYQGVPEALDPQWERELFTLPMAQQIAELLAIHNEGIEARGKHGDQRGTTLDLQVPSNDDDGFTNYIPPSNNSSPFGGTPNAYSNTSSVQFVGCRSAGDGQSINDFHRWTGVSGLSGITVDVAFFSLDQKSADIGTPETSIWFDDSESPTAPTTKEEHNSKTRTTNNVTWDNMDLGSSGFTNSPSIISIIQELVDSYDPSAFQVLHDDDLFSDSDNNANPNTYDNGSSLAAKLHIEYVGTSLSSPSETMAAQFRAAGIL